MEKYDTINNKQAKSLLKKMATKYGETSNIYLEIEDCVEQFTLSDDTVDWPSRSVVILNKTLEKCRVLEEMKKQSLAEQKLRRLIRNEIKKNINEESDSDYESVYNSIDWDAVGAEILRTWKLKTKLSFTYSSGGRGGGKYGVKMESDDIIKQCGIFQYAIGTCKLTFFNTTLTATPGSETKFWATINLSYPGNGMVIGTLWVKEDGKIVIQKDTPRSRT